MNNIHLVTDYHDGRHLSWSQKNQQSTIRGEDTER